MVEHDFSMENIYVQLISRKVQTLDCQSLALTLKWKVKFLIRSKYDVWFLSTVEQLQYLQNTASFITRKQNISFSIYTKWKNQ